MTYEEISFKIPIESSDYLNCSEFVINSVEEIIKGSIKNGMNKIIINTNLKKGLPMENINKIAGPFVEAWAQEIFNFVLEDENNKYNLVSVEDGERLNMADVILQFKRVKKSTFQPSVITGNIDVKATSEDIEGSGKSPNITSFKRIRNAYIEDPDYIFIILSLKHKVYSERNYKTNTLDGVMEVVNFHAYDLKLISEKDISYNPALGTGQLQVRDIHYVDIVKKYRNCWEFCQILDKKFISSKKGFLEWLRLAIENEWIKNIDNFYTFFIEENLESKPEWKSLAKRNGWL